MDVHPPHGAIHGWRDFFVQLAAITIGLLIALGLVGLVEWRQHQHLLHEAESNLASELRANRSTLAKDQKSVEEVQKRGEENLAILAAFKANHHGGGELKFYWQWSSMNSAAWDAARNTAAVALMDYDLARKYSDVYAQQLLVNEQASVFVRDIYRSAAPLEGGRTLAQLNPGEIDTMIVNIQQTLADLNYLRDLNNRLSAEYERNQLH
jgi:hypothetical protein